MRDHVPRHLLEQLVIDDPRAPVRPVLRVHVAACDRCSMRQRALEAARTGYLVNYPATDFVAAVLALAAQPEHVRRRGLAAWKPAWILAAAAVLIVAPVVAVLWFSDIGLGALRATPPGPLWISVQHGTAKRVLEDGTQLAAGDRLSVGYTLDRPGHLLLLGIDAGGTIRRYFPNDAAFAEPLIAARGAQLPIELDPSAEQGDEHLFALLSDAPLDEVAVRGTLAGAMNRARASSRGVSGLSELDVHAQQIHVWFRRPQH